MIKLSSMFFISGTGSVRLLVSHEKVNFSGLCSQLEQLHFIRTWSPGLNRSQFFMHDKSNWKLDGMIVCVAKDDFKACRLVTFKLNLYWFPRINVLGGSVTMDSKIYKMHALLSYCRKFI